MGKKIESDHLSQHSVQAPTDKGTSAIGNEKTRKSRRRLIQLFAAGGVVASANTIPTEWKRPLVNATSLPVHANTTGSVIVLGNNANFVEQVVANPEPVETLVASGSEPVTWSGITDMLIEQTHAQDSPVDCLLTGCAWIQYDRGETTGKLYISTFFDDYEFNFVDGVRIFTNVDCLVDTARSFIVNLVNDGLAVLTISDNGKNITAYTVNLTAPFVCEPVEDS